MNQEHSSMKDIASATFCAGWSDGWWKEATQQKKNEDWDLTKNALASQPQSEAAATFGERGRSKTRKCG